MTEEQVRAIVKEEIALAIKNAKKKPRKSDIEATPEMIEVYNAYREIGDGLPHKSKSFTKNMKIEVNRLLLNYSLEQIRDSLQNAAGSWITSRFDQIWCNEAWIFKNLEGWMPGGKYMDDKKEYVKKDAVINVKVEDFDDIF